MELNNRLIELQDLIYHQYTYDKKLEELNEMKFYLKDKLKGVINKLENMDINIKSLEKKSMIYIWYDLFTSKGKSVSKVEHDYKIFSDLNDFIQNEMVGLKNKLEQIESYKLEYKELLEDQEKVVLDSEKEKNEKLSHLILESIKYKNRIRDLNEAINTSNYLSSSLEYLVDLLKKTKDWDNIDIFGRGLFLSLTKSSIFKQTEDKVKKLHYLANKFVRELKVINFYMDLTIDVSEISRFVDYYENELYDDIKDNKRLLNTMDSINEGYEIINQACEILKINKEEYLKQLINIEKDKQQMM